MNEHSTTSQPATPVPPDDLQRAKGKVALITGANTGVGKELARQLALTNEYDKIYLACRNEQKATYFRGRKADTTLAYAQVKYVGALWMAATARRYPHLRLLTVSPGNTRGTEGTRDLPLPLRLLLKYVLNPVVFPLFGMVHNLDAGARRLIDGLNDDALKSGVFYASKANTLIGPVIDQSEIFPDLSNPTYQDNAREAVHRFI